MIREKILRYSHKNYTVNERGWKAALDLFSKIIFDKSFSSNSCLEAIKYMGNNMRFVRKKNFNNNDKNPLGEISPEGSHKD